MDLATSDDDPPGTGSLTPPVLYLAATLVLGLAAAWLGLEITA